MEYFEYSFPEPPYFLLVAGLLASIASGLAFSATLQQAVKEWSKSRSTRTLATLQGSQLLIPFLGISIGVCVFLASGLEIFGLPAKFTYGVSLPMTLLIGGLIWYQLGQLLVELERGGSKAIDLDSWG